MVFFFSLNLSVFLRLDSSTVDEFLWGDKSCSTQTEPWMMDLTATTVKDFIVARLSIKMNTCNSGLTCLLRVFSPPEHTLVLNVKPTESARCSDLFTKLQKVKMGDLWFRTLFTSAQHEKKVEAVRNSERKDLNHC